MVANILSSVVIWALLAVCIFKIIVESGLFVTMKEKVPFLFCEKKRKGFQPGFKDFAKIAGIAVLFRLAIFFLSWLALFIFKADQSAFTLEQTVGEWQKWDANNYIRIATLGYDGYTVEVDGVKMYSTLVFFPLYSWIIKALLFVINSEPIAALLASSFCYVMGCCYFYGFVSLEYGKRIAEKALVLISVFPFSFFFGAMMPESTFFFVGAASLYYIKKHKWWLAAIFGFFAALSRMQGVLLVVPAFVEWLIAYQPLVALKEKRFKDFFSLFFEKLCWMVMVAFGPLLYFYKNYQVTGDPFKFLEYQEKIWFQHAQYFGKTVQLLWDNMLDRQDFTKVTLWGSELVVFIFVCLVLIYGVRKHKPSYTLFLLMYLIMNFTPSWLLSAGRYMTVALPLYFILAEFLDRRPRLYTVIVSAFSMLFMLYMYGFFCQRQIF